MKVTAFLRSNSEEETMRCCASGGGSNALIEGLAALLSVAATNPSPPEGERARRCVVRPGAEEEEKVSSVVQ